MLDGYIIGYVHSNGSDYHWQIVIMIFTSDYLDPPMSYEALSLGKMKLPGDLPRQRTDPHSAI